MSHCSGTDCWCQTRRDPAQKDLCWMQQHRKAQPTCTSTPHESLQRGPVRLQGASHLATIKAGAGEIVKAAWVLLQQLEEIREPRCIWSQQRQQWSQATSICWLCRNQCIAKMLAWVCLSVPQCLKKSHWQSTKRRLLGEHWWQQIDRECLVSFSIRLSQEEESSTEARDNPCALKVSQPREKIGGSV